MNRVLIGIFVTVGIALLGIGAVNVLFVPFLTNVLHVPPAQVGIAKAAQVAGMLAGGAIVASGRGLTPTRLLSGGIFVLGVLLALLSLTRNLAQLVLLLPLIGCAATVQYAGSETLLQQHVPHELRGRVESALDSLLTWLMFLSMAAAGALGDVLGIRHVLLAAGGFTCTAGVFGRIVMGAQATSRSGTVKRST
jgi:MFS family permease